MKITAKLAYSQLKVNRSRTMWSIVAVALSTALMMAICSFMASGNTMLVDLLGSDYGDYGKSYQVLLLIPMVIFGILIMSMTITVIANVFRISTQDRISQFGMLKCTGATPKQIKETVMYESVWLCLYGIPIGLVLGVILADVGIGVANHFLTDLNALAHLMIHEINVTLSFVFSWKALLFSALFSALIVFYSAWRPAHRAANISAIQCIHGVDDITVEEKTLKDNKLVTKIFGFEGCLANKNLKRNHRNFRATVISLSIGIILFISLGGLVQQAKGIQSFMDIGIEETVITEYMSDYRETINPETGEEERSYLHPIDSGTTGQEITQRLEDYGNINIWGMGSDMDTYHVDISPQKVTSAMREAYEDKTPAMYSFPVEMVTLDQENYEKVCGIAGVSVGSTILLNNYSYNDFGHEKSIEPLVSTVDQMELKKADGSILPVEIQGVLTGNQMPAEMLYPGTQPIRLLVPRGEMRGFTWYCAPENEADFMDYANGVMAEYFKGNSADSYMKEGFDTRVYLMEEYMQVMNIAISLVLVFMYSFVALIMLIGLTNVISTLSTNVFMRAKEFAVLKSVGMTTKSLRRMLNDESILCALKALAIGVPIGIVVTLFINLPIRMMYPVAYELPWQSIILCILVVFLITGSTVGYASHKLQNQNIIETIRAACGK